MISLEIQHIASLVSIMKCGILYPYIHYMIRTYQILFETMMIEMKVAASLAEHSRLFLKDDVHLWYHTFRDLLSSHAWWIRSTTTICVDEIFYWRVHWHATTAKYVVEAHGFNNLTAQRERTNM